MLALAASLHRCVIGGYRNMGSSFEVAFKGTIGISLSIECQLTRVWNYMGKRRHCATVSASRGNAMFIDELNDLLLTLQIFNVLHRASPHPTITITNTTATESETTPNRSQSSPRPNINTAGLQSTRATRSWPPDPCVGPGGARRGNRTKRPLTDLTASDLTISRHGSDCISCRRRAWLRCVNCMKYM